MSLLRFLRRDKEERKPAATEPALAPIPVTQTASRTVTMASPAQVRAHSPAPLDLEKIRRELQEIAQIVGEEEMGSVDNVSRVSLHPTIALRLADVVKMANQAFKNPEALSPVSDTRLAVEVPDLYDQLAKGKITTKLNMLVADVPSDHLSDYVSLHGDDPVSLPLHIVVAAIEPGELRKRTAFIERDLGDKALPNLFTIGSFDTSAPVDEASPAAAAIPEPVIEIPEPEPEAPVAYTEPVVAQEEPVLPTMDVPHVEQPVEEPAAIVVPEPEPEPVVASEPVVAEPEVVAESVAVNEPFEPVVSDAAPQVTASAPAEEVFELDEEDIEDGELTLAQPEAAPVAAVAVAPLAEIPPYAEHPRVLLAGLDVNYATAEELATRLNGVGIRLARRVVEERLNNGPYRDVFDLARVPGLRRKRFEEVTGVRWDGPYFKYRAMVNSILETEIGAMPDVRRVAARFAEVAGFTGCIVIHEDGIVLAGTWNDPASDRLGAFAPQMFKKVERYVKQLRMGDIRTLSFLADHQPITIVSSGKIFFVALHEQDTFTRKQIEMTQALATELGRRVA